MKKILAVAIMVLSGKLLMADELQDALNGTLIFTTGGDGNWIAQSETTHDGVLAVQSPRIDEGGETWIETTVTGPALLSFWVKSSGYGECHCEVSCSIGGCYDRHYNYTFSGTFSGARSWEKMVVTIPSGEHTVGWHCYKWYDWSDYHIWLDDITISNVLTVEFDCGGGTVNGEKNVSRDFAFEKEYGTLPAPVREGSTFLGWYTAEGKEVCATDVVSFYATTKLFARWWTAKLEGFEGDVVRGNDMIYSERDDIVIPLPTVDDCWEYLGYDENNYFEVACNGEAIVSFDWVVETKMADDVDIYWDYCYGYAEYGFTVDGEDPGVKGCNGHVSFDPFVAYGNFDAGWKTNRVSVRAFLTPGTHALRWAVPYGYAENATVRCAVENFKIEPVVRQTDLIDWAKLLADFMIWKPDNLVYLRDTVYGARIAANPNDYEARVIRAAIKSALLAENGEVRNFIKDCGWTIADYTMKMSGEFCGLANLAPANGIVDRISPEILTSLDDALADLNAIPENWNGAIELSPDKYEMLNESVYVDMAEIMMFKAALESVRASILLVKGYDFTMDYVAVSNSIGNAEHIWEVLNNAPKAGYIRDANALLESKAWFKKSLQHIRRADQIILWRSNPLTHFFEYDLVDADNLARARLYLEQLIGSFDHPETIDLPYFMDKFGYKGEVLPMGMFRQLYLGAIFAGRITKDLVPDVQINPAMLYMDTVEDTTLGGLFPDLGFEEFATLFPYSQHWSLGLYDVCKPQTRLLKNQILTVTDESLCNGTLEYIANLRKLDHVTAQCVVNDLAIDTISVGERPGTTEKRSVAIPNNAQYSLVFTASEHSMRRRQQLFDIVGIPEVTPVEDGTYSQTIRDVTWNFTVSDDEATVTGVSGSLSGDLSIPEKLGGRVVTAIADDAFRRSGISSITIPATVKSIGIDAFARSKLVAIRFLGQEPDVKDGAFDNVSAVAFFVGGTVLSGVSDDGKWQGMAVQYVNGATNENLRVRASLTDGYEFNGMATLSLSVSGDATIYFTMNGAEPTTNALVYVSPISVSITTRIKYFAVDHNNGCSGPIGSLLLKQTVPDAALLSNSEYSKTVNGVAWSYQEQGNGVRLMGNNGTATGEKLKGIVDIPAAINWQPVNAIGAGLFACCDSITSLRIPSTVKEIERDAFKGCTRLESVTLPDGLLSIGDGAFERCTSLTNVIIPASVTNIGYFAFRDCLRLTDVVLKGEPPRQDLGVYMGVPAFTTISGRLGAATAIIYAVVTNSTPEITVPEGWLYELAVAYDKPAGADSYLAAFKEKFGEDMKVALTKPTGKYDLKGNPLYVWQDYVAGTNPLDEEDKFMAKITVNDGIPVVSWTPELPPAAAAMRKYTVYGATALNGRWVDVSDKTDEQRHDLGYQFFSVTVEMR